MSDTLTVRDHSQPCEHEPPWVHAHQLANGKWCPGGREIRPLSDEAIERAARVAIRMWAENDEDYDPMPDDLAIAEAMLRAALVHGGGDQQ